MTSDPYNIKDAQQLKEDRAYTKCSYKNCDSCNNFVNETTCIECNATGRKYKIRRDASYNLKNVIYVAYCMKCMKQGIGTTTSWKPCLSIYKSHIEKKKLTCRIVRHFIENCNENGFNNLRFIIVDCLNNVESLTDEEIKDLFKKEKFWISIFVARNHGLYSKHDLNRKKRCELEKLNH